MPNPSTIASHFEDELAEQRAIAFDLRRPKEVREEALRKVRQIEDTLGIDSQPINHVPYDTEQDVKAFKPAILTSRQLRDAREQLLTLTLGEISQILIALSRGSFGDYQLLRRLLNAK